MTLSRRDRAALVLAYECLRRRHADVWDEAEPLHCGGYTCRELLGAYTLVHDADSTNYRVLRVRLALYIRALLRADAGDCGPARVTYALVGTRPYEPGLPIWRYEPRYTNPWAPLWQSTPYTGPTLTQPSRTWSGAPAHDPAVTPRMRREARTR